MVLKDVIKIDERFQTSVNIRFDIDKTNKIDEFIPAKSTLDVLETYLENIFEKGNNKNFPLPVILDGEIDYETLAQIKKDEQWLDKVLKERSLNLDNVFYAFYKDKNLFIIEKETVK